MRWIVFVVITIVAVALETSDIRDLLTLHSIGDLYPSIVGVLVVFIALFAPRNTALWSSWMAGVLMDLATIQERGILIGPHALGYVFGAYFVLQIRTVVFRRKVLTVMMLTLMFLAASGVVEVAVLTVRSWIDGGEGLSVGFRPIIELLRRFGIAIYSAALGGIVVGWLLLQSLPVWAFQHTSDRRRTWR